MLPLDTTQIKKLVGTKQAPRDGLKKQESSKQLKRSDSRNSSSSRLGIAAVGTAIEPSQPALDNVLFDADFECGNID